MCSRSLHIKWYVALIVERLLCCRKMANAVTSPPEYSWACCRHDAPSCLPKGIQHLALPPLFLPDDIVEDVNNLAELTRLECNTFNSYWPSQDLIGLKVRSGCR